MQRPKTMVNATVSRIVQGGVEDTLLKGDGVRLINDSIVPDAGHSTVFGLN